MCTSIKTTMACGHAFNNYATTCSTLPSSRSCVPSINTQHLNDTCAACDPAARRRRVRLDYESRHGELMARYITAKRTGDSRVMARVERLVLKNAMTTMERNFEIGIPRQEEDVLWWETDSEREC
ncbi:hypothetical protein F66182_424 [Fusarium sp. NRRL 66182]|nr:hypothetical protein F66182_424 [Fusarium sp. NRRL 66182]